MVDKFEQEVTVMKSCVVIKDNVLKAMRLYMIVIKVELYENKVLNDGFTNDSYYGYILLQLYKTKDSINSTE